MAGSDESLIDELLDLKGLVRAHLEWEADADGPGVPVAQPLVRLHARVTPLAPLEETEDHVLALHPSMQPPPPPSIEPASPRLAADERRVRLSTIAHEVSTCVKCDLAKSRTNTVFARGNPDSELVFVGEGPGYNEDLQGSPFVGQAGQLLDKMISAMGFNVDDVYICNVVKCRPPENRNPLPPEMDACLPYLTEQLRAVSPRVIVALGRVAGQGLGCFTPESKGWRGVWRTWDSIPVMPTYHPAFLLRSPQFKRQVWEDLQKVMTRLGKG